MRNYSLRKNRRANDATLYLFAGMLIVAAGAYIYYRNLEAIFRGR